MTGECMTMPVNKRIVLCGAGTVGKAFLRLLNERRVSVEGRYGLRLDLSAVVDIGGAAVSDSRPLPLDDLLRRVDGGEKIERLSPFGRPGMSCTEVLSHVSADILVEATPTNLRDGEPARTHFLAAIDRGMDVVTANKGPLVLCYREMMLAARQKGCRLFMSAATAAALPTLDVGLLCLAGSDVMSIEGVLNGTTNYILSRMHQDRWTYENALKDARRMGIAESDPTDDVEGFDTRNKLIIIANRVFGKTFGIQDVAVKGITAVSPADIQSAQTAGRVVKLIGAAKRVGGALRLDVAPKELDRQHPLAAVNGPEKGIHFLTDTMGGVTVTGGKSSPTGAAAALLKDLIHTVMIS